MILRKLIIHKNAARRSLKPFCRCATVMNRRKVYKKNIYIYIFVVFVLLSKEINIDSTCLPYAGFLSLFLFPLKFCFIDAPDRKCPTLRQNRCKNILWNNQGKGVCVVCLYGAFLDDTLVKTTERKRRRKKLNL